MMNAAESMNDSEERSLMIRTRGEHEHLLIIVEDRGHGVAAEDLEMIFEPFFTTREKQVGLGLAVGKRIVNNHHGKIWVENNPNGGASFYVRIPR